MSSRASAALAASTRYHLSAAHTDQALSEQFGCYVFNRAVMRKMLPTRVYQNLCDAIDGKGRIDPANADRIADAIREWAMGLGATHYTHWFQPLTGMTAEKHDAFMDLSGGGEVMERFSGKSLLQGEPDASSFPSGGLRSTYEARGYTGWDPSSPPFLWRGGDGMTLCIPSVFFSYTGEILDTKIPLLRSEHWLGEVVLRLLKLAGVKASKVYCTLGWEQEYFVVDRALRNLRPDLVMLGRTVYGRSSAKGQQFEDHYLGAVQDRILAYMRDSEIRAVQLGIPIKTRHNEVAPGQHESAPAFQRAALSVDHNILFMELMRQVAVQHDLACLLDEKPFAGVNGSGKHLNWSLATDTGVNLLDPTDSPENRLPFLVLLAAILQGVHRHSDLLRASIASPSNDFRLGANEAPPAIISVYLGEALESLFDQIEKNGIAQSGGKSSDYDLGVPVIPDLPRENTDRNRTSPFAFTGNKFEYRACGSHASCAWPTTVLNCAVAESLSEMLDEIGKKGGDFTESAIDVVRTSLAKSRAVRFSGNNYSSEWAEEAKRRGLPNVKESFDAYAALKEEKARQLFEGILTAPELESRYEILADDYRKVVEVEGRLMVDLFHSHVLPAAVKTQGQLTSDLPTQKSHGQRVGEAIERALKGANQVEELLEEEGEGDFASKRLRPAYVELREAVDELEKLCDDALWPLPKYWELLFLK